MLYAEKGELQKSMVHLRTFESGVNEKGLTSTYTYGRWIMVGLLYSTEVLIGLGDLTKAGSTARKAAEVASGTRNESVGALSDAIRGKLLSSEGRFADAQVSFEKAIETFRKINWAFLLAKALYDLGVACGKNGEVEKSKNAFAEAKKIYARMGATTYLDRVVFAEADIPVRR